MSSKVSGCYEPQIGSINLTDETIAKLLEGRVDVEKYEYCNPDTGTKWVKVCSYTADENGVVSQNVLDEFDTGFSCIAGYSFEESYCVKA